MESEKRVVKGEMFEMFDLLFMFCCFRMGLFYSSSLLGLCARAYCTGSLSLTAQTHLHDRVRYICLPLLEAPFWKIQKRMDYG